MQRDIPSAVTEPRAFASITMRSAGSCSPRPTAGSMSTSSRLAGFRFPIRKIASRSATAHGHEIRWIERLADLPADVRTVLETDLRRREFMPDRKADRSHDGIHRAVAMGRRNRSRPHSIPAGQ